jgi:hypothetical protein
MQERVDPVSEFAEVEGARGEHSKMNRRRVNDKQTPTGADLEDISAEEK